MNKKLANSVLIVVQVLLVAGIVFAFNRASVRASIPGQPLADTSPSGMADPGTPPQVPQSADATAVKLAEKITYQGVLEINGIPLDGGRNMEFNFFTNDACSGVALYAYSAGVVTVKEGVFSVEIPIGQSNMWGQGLWLQVKVGSKFLGCEEILAVPFAYSLRPGAQIYGTPTNFDGWVLKAQMSGSNPNASAVLGMTTTGFAVKGDSANGTALYGTTQNGFAVYAEDTGTVADRGVAGYFSSTNGRGIDVIVNSTAHYNHAGNFYANGGYGIYANSINNTGIRGETGTTAELAGVSSSTAGVVGRGGDLAGVFGGSRSASGVVGSSTESYGVSGSSTNYYGIYGHSTYSYGIYGYSTYSSGVYGSSPSGSYAGYFDSRGGSSQPGLYTDGYFIATGSKGGYVVDIARNEGIAPLETGDVVVIVGADAPVIGEIPLLLVKKAVVEASSTVAGVVDQPFSIPASAPSLLTEGADAPDNLPIATASIASIQAGTAVQAGDYVSIVTLGSFKQIKVDATYGAISPGDILVSSPNPGYAMRTDTPQYGTIIGKALGDLASGIGSIPVLVTLD
jgi:hypothetical protein